MYIMSYLQLRLTHSLVDDLSRDDALQCIRKYATDISAVKFMYCVEDQDKFGKDTHEHIHFNCYIDDDDAKTDTYQRKFKRQMEKFGFPISGNKHYSLKVLVDVGDEDRWWRYIMKQEKNIKIGSHGFTTPQLNEWRKLAVDERLRQIQKNNEHLDNFLDKSSFKGKMYVYFNEELVIRTHKNFVINYIKYCQKHHKVPSFQKIEDYWIDYRLQVGLLTPEDWYKLTYE